MTPAARGFLVMAVREARWGRDSLRDGDTFAALNRLCWAHRFLSLADRELWEGEGTPRGTLDSLMRATRAVDAVMHEFAAYWPSRMAGMRRDLQAVR